MRARREPESSMEVAAITEHQYEARCECGNHWRVYRTEVGEDDDPMATCINCGADTYDLVDIGEVKSAGRDMPT